MRFSRSIAAVLAGCVTLALLPALARADEFQVKAAVGDLPPWRVLDAISKAPALQQAVLKELKLKLVDQFRDPQTNTGSQVLRLQDESGIEHLIALNAVYTSEEEDPSLRWGSLYVYPFQDGTVQRTDEQEQKTKELCTALTAAWARQLESTLRNLAAAGIQREEDLGQQRLKIAELRLESAMKELEELRTALQDVERQVAMPATVLETQLSEAMSQQQSLELELAGLQARREALERRIEKLSADAISGAAKDEVVASLQSVVDVRTQQVEVLRAAFESGRAAPQDREAALAELATAKAALAEARRDAVKQQGGGALDLLQNDLAQSFIRQEECRAKQEFLAKRVDVLTEKLRIESTLVQPLRDKLPAAARRVESLEDAKFAAEVELERAASQRQPVQVRLLTPPPTEQSADGEK